MNPQPTPPTPRPAAPPPTWRSHELLQGQPEVHIVHGTEVYRLRRTALGKLILTK
jgi:hemin uptake protein HemP